MDFHGGGPKTDPFAYIGAFFAACDGCRVDLIAAHCHACDWPALAWELAWEKVSWRAPMPPAARCSP